MARLAGAVLAAGVVVATLVAHNPSASAHVEIDADGATPGGNAHLRINVPTEAGHPATVRIVVDLPSSIDIPYVWVRPPKRWRATLERRTLSTPIRSEQGEITEVVSRVTFDGGSIPPGEFDSFSLLLGPLPGNAGDLLTFPTVQTYADGTSDRWVDLVESGEPEPDHPVPSVVLQADQMTTPGEAGESNAKDTLHLVLGVLGVFIGAVALAVGVVSLARSRNLTRDKGISDT